MAEFFIVLGVISAVWIGYDANQRRWGSELAVPGWIVSALIAWFVVVPCYLAVRGTRPRRKPLPATGVAAIPPPAQPRRVPGEWRGSDVLASDDERALVVDLLRTAYLEGRLTSEEFDERASSAHEARTRGALYLLVTDLDAAARAQPDAGWYPDPELPGHKRYWDGTRWTDFRHRPGEPVRRVRQGGWG